MIDLPDDWILFCAFSTYALNFSHSNPTVQIGTSYIIITTYKWEMFILEVILTKSSSPAIPRLLKTTHLKMETVNSIVHVNFTKRDNLSTQKMKMHKEKLSTSMSKFST